MALPCGLKKSFSSFLTKGLSNLHVKPPRTTPVFWKDSHGSPKAMLAQGFTYAEAKMRVNTCRLFTFTYAQNYIFILSQAFHNPSSCVPCEPPPRPNPSTPSETPRLFAQRVKTAGREHHSPSELESHLKVVSDLEESWTLACWLRRQKRENVLQPLGSLQFSFKLLIRGGEGGKQQQQQLSPASLTAKV